MVLCSPSQDREQASLYQVVSARARVWSDHRPTPSFLNGDGYLKAGITSFAMRSSSFMMCACGMPGKNVRQIKCVIP